MPTGILGQSAPAATTNTTVYTVPAATVATCTVNITNTSALDMNFRLAVASTSSPTSSEWLEYDAIIPAGGTYQNGGIVANANEQFVVFGGAAGLSVSIYGYEA